MSVLSHQQYQRLTANRQGGDCLLFFFKKKVQTIIFFFIFAKSKFIRRTQIF